MGILAGLTASQALLAGAGVSAGAGILGSIGTNISNKNIAQMNNAFNEKMLQKQMDYNTQMYERQLSDTWKFYNDQKEYNSASAQVQRFRDAGVNPALAMQSQGAGSVSSVTSPGAQGINPPTASPYSADYTSVGQAIGQSLQLYNELKNSKAQRDKVDAETKQINIENQYRAQKLSADIVNTMERTNDVKVRRQMQEQLQRVYGDMLQVDLDSKRQSLENMKEAFTGAVLDNAKKRFDLQVWPEQVKLQMSQMSANIAYLIASRQLSINQARTEFFKQAETSARAAGIRLDNQLMKDTFNDLVRQAEYATEKAKNNRGLDGGFGLFNAADRLYGRLNGGDW